jgi:drug/metabolite transporter (DMT)-like permease
MSDRAHEGLPGQVRGVVQTFAAAAALGTLGPVSGLAYATGVSPPAFSALRAAIGASVLGALVVSGREPRVRLAALPRSQRTMLGIAVLANALQNLALFMAFGAMAVALVMVIFYTYPVLVAGASAALGRERLSADRIGALACAGFGLALVLGTQLGPETDATLVGVALAGTAAACHATYFVVARDGFPSVPAVQATSLVLAGGVVVSGAGALLMEGSGVVGPWVESPAAWAAAVFAGTVGAAFSKVLVLRGVRTIGSTRAALVMLMEPVVAVVLASALLGQALTPAEVVGGAAILVAAVVVQRPQVLAEAEGPVAAELAD